VSSSLDHFTAAPANEYPTFAQAYVGLKRRGDPDFLYAAPHMFAYAAFYKESRIKFVDFSKPHRKYGRDPTIAIGIADDL
jgi:hypothetical protein